MQFTADKVGSIPFPSDVFCGSGLEWHAIASSRSAPIRNGRARVTLIRMSLAVAVQITNLNRQGTSALTQPCVELGKAAKLTICASSQIRLRLSCTFSSQLLAKQAKVGVSQVVRAHHGELAERASTNRPLPFLNLSTTFKMQIVDAMPSNVTKGRKGAGVASNSILWPWLG